MMLDQNQKHFRNPLYITQSMIDMLFLFSFSLSFHQKRCACVEIFTKVPLPGAVFHKNTKISKSTSSRQYSEK